MAHIKEYNEFIGKIKTSKMTLSDFFMKLDDAKKQIHAEFKNTKADRTYVIK